MKSLAIYNTGRCVDQINLMPGRAAVVCP